MSTITNIIYPAISVFAFASFALSPGARAVSPAPDGGYPGGNTAEGQSALLRNTTGSGNTAVGNVALEINTGGENTALGNAALQDNTTGSGNTAVGNFALSANSGA